LGIELRAIVRVAQALGTSKAVFEIYWAFVTPGNNKTVASTAIINKTVANTAITDCVCMIF